MTTIKSYTDIEQSKKLAKFLPHESADMCWVSNGLGKPFVRTISIKGDPEELCACWSLAALLNVIPIWYDIHPTKSGVDMTCDDYGNNVVVISDNLVDACHEMIIKLHERKML